MASVTSGICGQPNDDLIIMSEYAVTHIPREMDRRWKVLFPSVISCLDHEFMATGAHHYRREFWPLSGQRVSFAPCFGIMPYNDPRWPHDRRLAGWCRRAVD